MYNLNASSNNYQIQHKPREMIMCREQNVCDEDSRDSGISEMDFEMPTSFSDIFNSKDKTMEIELDITERQLEKTTLYNKRERLGLSDITNSNFESPKCRKNFSNFAKPFARVHTFGQSRKRINADSAVDVKRNKLDDNNSNKSLVAHRRNSMPRTHSSSVLERGQYAHVEDELPKPLIINYHLPHLAVDSQAYRRIHASTLSQVMSSMSNEEFNERYILIDCRYPYEYEGGHIKNAINIFNPDRCTEVLYPSSSTEKKRIPIFYCEYSQKRGPSMAQFIRAFDRKKNMLSYPKLDHQEMYVLDKGYKHFYESHHDSQYAKLCEPCNYTTMDDTKYALELKQFTYHKKGPVGATGCRKELSNVRSRLRQHHNGDDSNTQKTSQRKLFQPCDTIKNVAHAPLAKLPPIPNPQFS